MPRTETEHALLMRLKQRSYKEGTFTLSSGKQSDFFIDCKKTFLQAMGGTLAARAIAQRRPYLNARPDAVAGVALGGCHLASLVAAVFGSDTIYVRKEPKDHGTKQLVESAYGTDTAGRTVLLVEDVVTTGASTLKAAAALREAGFIIMGIVALVDRLEGGAAAIREAGYDFAAVFTRDDFTEKDTQSVLLGDKESIVAAAVLEGGSVYHALPPGRHHTVLHAMARLGVRHDNDLDKQGFLTSKGRFVGRVEAKIIAKNADQLLERAGTSNKLYSEDVW